MTTLTLDTATAERMGYLNAVAATTLYDDDIAIEFALVPPGEPVSGHRWAVIVHMDCDPEQDDRGVSSVEPCENRDDAEADYLERIEEITREIEEKAQRRAAGRF